MATNPSLELWVRLGAVHPLGAWCSQYNLNRRTGTAGKFAQTFRPPSCRFLGCACPTPGFSALILNRVVSTGHPTGAIRQSHRVFGTPVGTLSAPSTASPSR